MYLVVADEYRREWIGSTGSADAMRILAVNRPPQSFIDAAQREGRRLDGGMFLPIAPLAHQAKRMLREFVPRFYAELPRLGHDRGRPLAERLFAGEPAAWWLTDISEKSIFRGRLIARLYILALLRKAIEAYRPTEIRIALRDRALSELIASELAGLCRIRPACGETWVAKGISALRKTIEAAAYPCRALVVAWGTLAETVLLKLLAGPRRPAGTEPSSGKRVTLFSFFPGWWRNPWDDRDRREVFYQGLPGRLEARGFEVRHALWVGINRHGLFRLIAGLRRLHRSGGFLCLQSLVGVRQGIGLLGLKPLKWCLRVMRLRPLLEDCRFAGFHIGGLVRDDLLGSVSHRELFRNLLLRCAMEKLPACDLVIFRTEFQPFERAILRGLKPQGTPTVGYQHSSVGKDYLSHVFVPEQFQRADDRDALSLPVPDHLVMTGRHVARLMRENGFPPERLHIAGPLRYQELRLRLRAPERTPAGRGAPGGRILLVPVSLDRLEALGFAAVLAEALRGQEARFVLHIKGHPANDHARDFVAYLHDRNEGIVTHLVSREAGLHDHIRAASALVMTGSTVGLEAIALGVPVILFVNDHVFSFTASSLLAVGQAVVDVHDVVSLKQALHRLYDEGTPFPEVRQHWPGAAQEMFDDFDADPEDRFCTIVDEVLRDHRTASTMSVSAV